MFSMQNNKEDVAFMFSSELKNKSGIKLATNFLSKGGSNLNENNLETIVRQSIFPEIPRRQIEKLSLKIYRTMYKLPKRDMVNYRIEISEEWQVLGSNFDLIKIYVRKNKEVYEKVGSKGYVGFPTYFPCYLRNAV